MQAKTYAQLKRDLQAGTIIKLIDSSIENHKSLGVERKIVKKQTNAIMLEGGSWLNMGSTGETAKDFTYQGDVFTYDERYRDEQHAKYGVMLKYQIVTN